MKKILSVIAFCISASTVFGFKTKGGDNITISDTSREDIYISAGTVTINAPVLADLIIAGGTVIINDSVAGDILVVGGEVTFNGVVGDDIRCAGGRLFVRNKVWGDLITAGGEVTIDKGTEIGGLMVAGGNINLNGIVMGSATCYAGNLVFNGEIKEEAFIKGGTLTMNGIIMGESVLAAREINIEPAATFHHQVRYWTGKGEIDFKNSLKNGKAVFDPTLEIKGGRWEYLGFMTFLGVLWYMGMVFISISVIQYLFENTLSRGGKTLTEQSWKSFGYGFLFFIGVPVAAIIAFITLIGVPVGVALLVGYIVCLIFATSLTALVISHWFSQRNNRNWGFWRTVFVAFGLFILLKVLGMFPIIGGLFGFVIICFAFGAIILSLNFKRKKNISTQAS